MKRMLCLAVTWPLCLGLRYSDHGKTIFFIERFYRGSNLIHFCRFPSTLNSQKWKRDQSCLSRKCFSATSLRLVVFSAVVGCVCRSSNAPINSNLLNIPPPGIPLSFDHFPYPWSREFDVKFLPEGGEFEVYPGGVGNLNLKCQVYAFLLVQRNTRGYWSMDEFKGEMSLCERLAHHKRSPQTLQ